MGTTVAFVPDLIFSTKITGTAKAIGQGVKIVRGMPAMQEALASKPSLVIVDLNAAGEFALPAIMAAKAAGVPKILAYCSHVDVGLAKAASEAGATSVMPRSAFTTNLPELLKIDAAGA